ncbi:hypothetical protein ABT127_34630 [Streptomyces sp. NPDC001904]|uniref:hypothetical protein n=1 Tax=Streptomyces sp. NPDC001904 TaxID=3154531 RepID=UPI0033226C00
MDIHELDHLNIDELRAALHTEADRLPDRHPVRLVWERLDETLTARGPEYLNWKPRTRELWPVVAVDLSLG